MSIGAPPRPATPAPAEDGRHLRRDRNRAAVVDALLGLYREGNLQPSSAEVAERAQLSSRSVFRYFDDVDDLARAAIQRQYEHVAPLLAIAASPTDPLPQRLRALANQRVALFDAIGPVGQVTRMRATFQPVVEAELRRSRSYLRRQISRLLAPELGALPAAEAAAVLATADVLCSYESYHLLRADQGLTRPKVVALLVSSLTALLTAESSPS